MIKIRTYVYEYVIVTFILSVITYFWANNLDNWIATLAVLVTFGYTQISDRLQYAARLEAKRIDSEWDLHNKKTKNYIVECYWKLNYYFWAKEILWVILFIRLQSYASLGGCVLFLLYPFWRNFYRSKIKPL